MGVHQHHVVNTIALMYHTRYVYTQHVVPFSIQRVEAFSSAVGRIEVLRPAAYTGCPALYTPTRLFYLHSTLFLASGRNPQLQRRLEH